MVAACRLRFRVVAPGFMSDIAEVCVTMKICETFISVQGEGPRAGRPCFFIRTAGCNLDCDWCDTTYARADEAVDMSVAEVVDAYRQARVLSGLKVTSNACPLLVCVTGGEPMLQPDMPSLLAALVADGADVDLMTNGTVDLACVPREVGVVMDVKVARLNTSSPVAEGALKRLGSGDAVKFVVRDRREFDLAADWAVSNDLFSRVQSVFVAPAWGHLDPATLVEWIFDSEPHFRLGLQLHKYVWGPETRK